MANPSISPHPNESLILSPFPSIVAHSSLPPCTPTANPIIFFHQTAPGAAAASSSPLLWPRQRAPTRLCVDALVADEDAAADVTTLPGNRSSNGKNEESALIGIRGHLVSCRVACSAYPIARHCIHKHSQLPPMLSPRHAAVHPSTILSLP